jgi:hypothetical protein
VKARTALIAIVIVIGAAAAALVKQNQAQVKLIQENADLRQQVDQLAALQADNERLSNQLAQAQSGGGGGQRLAPDQLRELVKLRGEVSLLRSQKNQLQSQSSELENLREENRQLRDRPSAQAAAPAAPRIDPEVARTTCINNLRLIDAAKQQCAAALNLKITESVSAEQLAPYLKATLQCPLGGVYNVGPIGYKPSCSIPGHTLQ